MTVSLPTDPAPNGAKPTYVDFGGFNEPALGGRVQRIDRPGNRFRFSFTMPPLPNKDLGRVFVARLIKGKSEGIRIPLPLLSFDPGTPGSIVVNGGGQAGTSLNVRGGTAGYAAKEGQFFSVVHAGEHVLHLITADTTLNGSGVGMLPIEPPLRVEFSDGDICHFAQPMIEGRVLGKDWDWEMRLDHSLGLAFDVEEWG